MTIEANIFQHEFSEFLHDVYGLKTMIRYNNTPRIQNESVAEHLAFTTLLVLKLREYFAFNLEHAMIMAITHDIPEVYTSDVPHPIKAAFPKLAEALREVETHSWLRFPEEWKEANDEMEDGLTIESMVVQLADVLSCVQYTKMEAEMGNSFMSRIHKKSTARVDVLLNTIQQRFPTLVKIKGEL